MASDWVLEFQKLLMEGYNSTDRPMKKEIRRMNAKGIIHGISERRHLDEAPSAYKDIDTVMANQVDLVKPIVQLSPLAVIKGD